MREALTRKAKVFWPLFFIVLLADCTTKAAAVSTLEPGGESAEVVGEVVRFTLAFNDRGAMGLSFGGYTMQVLGVIGFLASILLYSMYRSAPSRSVLMPMALAMILAGALGNAWERVFSARGVVDFIDVGIGTSRFYTFNVADIGITLGALALAIAFFTDDSPSPANAGEGAI